MFKFWISRRSYPICYTVDNRSILSTYFQCEGQQMKTLHWTLRDLELLPDDGNRYEIIDGELYVSKQPDWQHQLVCFQLGFLLETWNEQSQAGFVNVTPGIIFADDTNVVPDVIWISQERLKAILHRD